MLKTPDPENLSLRGWRPERELGGTAALAVVREWIEAAREREKVDQAVMVLEASARTKAASLS